MFTIRFQKAMLALALFALLAGPGFGFLKTRGQDIVDEQGRKVALRGVGLGNWMLLEGYMWRFGGSYNRNRAIEPLIADLVGDARAKAFWKEYLENYFTEADFKRIAELGFNSVRIPIHYKYFIGEGDDDAFKPEGFAMLGRMIEWAARHHLYVIVDLHAAPGGQTGHNIDDSANDRAEMFANERNKAKTVKLWREIARRYAGEKAVVGWDLLNEPLPYWKNNRACPDYDLYKKDFFPFYQRVAKAIREVDPNHIIILEGANWANEWNVLGKPFDPNLVYSFHKYWDKNDPASIQKYLGKQRAWGVPLWCGETGENNNQWYREALALLEKNNIGWAFWTWKKLGSRNNPYSITPPEGWRAIVEYTRGGPKPAADEAWRILQEYLKNIRLENCVYHEDAVKAIFRQ